VPDLAKALASPMRNLLGGVAFVGLVMAAATMAYVLCGWSLGDAFYMVMLTVFTVGFGEVRPIDTVMLRSITIALVGFGCTGMIFVTGALVQMITATQFSEILGGRRMTSAIERLKGHVIICGYGRIGRMLARELRAAGRALVVLERDEGRCAEAAAAGHLCLAVDASEEDSLLRAGVARAAALTTVLHDDALNVFITLSARSLNPGLTIIARGEAPSTERKLTQAGADRVVLPAHIGAERMAELLLFPEMEAAPGLERFGLVHEVVVADAASPWTGLTVGEVEARAAGAFLIVEIEREGRRERAAPQTRIAARDGVVVVGRSTAAAVAGFSSLQ